METIPSDVTASALAARERLSAAAQRTATGGAGPGNGGSQAAMAGAAREAIFVDALLSAMHARLEELKGVAK